MAATAVQPVGIAYPSKSGGAGHLVQIRTAEKGPKAGQQYVTCSCPGGKFSFARGTAGCWAMKAVRETFGIKA